MSPVRRQQRIRILLGCEGESERSYGTLLHQLVHSSGRLHIEAVLLGGGDPLAIVETAAKRIRKKEEDFGPYSTKAVILDHDRYTGGERDLRIRKIISSMSVQLIWQRPSHEGFLLRHIPGCHTHRPMTTANAIARIREHWPDYEKGCPAAYLSSKLTIDSIHQAASVEPELCEFLKTICYFE